MYFYLFPVFDLEFNLGAISRRRGAVEYLKFFTALTCTVVPKVFLH